MTGSQLSAQDLAVSLPFADGRLGRRKPGDRGPEGRAAYIVEANGFAELDRSGVAPMLAADPKLDARTRRASALDGDPDEITDDFILHVLEYR